MGEKIAKGFITSADLITALRTSNWLKEVKHDANYELIYQVFTDFCPNRGKGHNTKEMDALVVENLTINDCKDVILKGIEIIDSKQDLHHNIRLAEYTRYVDFLYIAVPDIVDIIEFAESIRRPEWGIMTIERSGSVRVIREPSYLHPTCREEMLTNVVKEFASLV